MWLDLQIFGFRALWSPYFFIFIVLIGITYALVTGKYRYKFGGVKKPTVAQLTQFYSALLLLYIVKGGPIDLLGHITLAAHMIQMAVYYLIFPILIIKGIPTWIWEKVVYNRVMKPFVKLVSKPLISLLLFNTLFSLYHMPVVFDFSKSSPVAHTTISLIILVAAFIVWWPVLTPLKEFNTMHPLTKIFYIFANGVLITPACVLIIFANDPVYAAYSSDGAWLQALSLCVPVSVLDGISSSLSGPQMFTGMSLKDDQQLGGIIMKTAQEFTYGFMLAKIFFSWFKTGSNKIDPLPDSIPKGVSESYQ